MNKTFLVSLLLLLSLRLWAQPIAPFHQSVFFASGSAVLDKTATATLDKLAKDIAKYRDFELDIEAFTDDVGSAEANQALAAKRSAAVKDFFKARNIVAASETVVNRGKVALVQGVSEEEQRRQNRRVDIKVSPFQPRDMKDVFTYFQQKNVQHFIINSQETAEIEGKNGVKVRIPADCFRQQEGGEAVSGEVKIELREMLDYGDMIRANLSTTCNGYMIETGGMIYMNATDSKGSALEIANGQNIEISFPDASNGTDNQGMELFVANRSSDSLNTAIEWQHANGAVPTIEQAAPTSWNETTLYFLQLLKEEMILPKDSFGGNIKTFPFSPLPTPPAEGTKFSKAYTKELDKIFAEMKQLIPKIAAPEDYNFFNAQSDARKAAAHLNYTYGTLQDALDVCKEMNLAQEGAVLERLIDSIDLDKKIALVDELRTRGLMDGAWAFTKRRWELEVVDEFKKLAEAKKTEKTWTEDHRDWLVSIYNTIQERFEQKGIAESYQYFNSNYNKLLNDMLSWENTLWSLRNESRLFEAFIRRLNMRRDAEDSLAIANIALTNLNANNLPQAYTPLVSPKLGWINCDRFLNEYKPADLITVNIGGERQYDTRFFVVFENIRSIMPATLSEGKYRAYNIPKNRTIKVLGMRIVAGELQTFETKGLASELMNIKATFTPSKIADGQRLLDSL